MKKKERIHCKQGLHDPDRAAYMIAWRDRHIEKQNALIKGYEEELSLMEALLAFALWQGASEAQEGRVARIPKKAVSEMLSKYKCEVQDGEEEFLVYFRTAEVPMNGGEQSAG